MTSVPAPPGTPDRVSDDLGWALAVVFRGYVKAADAVAEGLPGGHRAYQILSAAARDEPGSQAALAHLLGIDRTVMTYLLDDLVGAGLVERQPDPDDRRSRRVVLTARGRDMLADLDERFRRAEMHLLASLDDPEQQAFRSLLCAVAAHVNDLDPVATACDAVQEIRRRADQPRSGTAAARP